MSIRQKLTSDSMRILNVEPNGYSESAKLELEQLGNVDYLCLDRRHLLDRISDYEILIVRLSHQIDMEIMDAASTLKVIVSATTGLDHIDLTHATAKGIDILSLQDEKGFLKNVSASAEHTWALLLAISRRLPFAFESVKRDKWNRDAYKGHDLDGSKLGIVGYGRIGKKVANYGLAFNMSVSAFDPFIDNCGEHVNKMESLHQLLKHSDVISLHTPLNEDTRCMIGSTELNMMNRNAVLINTSRGEIIDEDALISALESKKIAGAAIAVLSNERSIINGEQNPLVRYSKNNENLILTPHIAGATYESMAKTELFMVNKLKHYLLNESCF